MIPVDKFPYIRALYYEEADGLISDGDILLCAGTSLPSKLIKLFTDSIWSHIALLMEIEGRMMVFESIESLRITGVRMVPLDYYVNFYDGRLLVARYEKMPVGCGYTDEMLHFLFNSLGQPYDRRELIRIAMRMLGIERSERHNQRYICSELVWEAYNKVGIRIPYDGNFITPHHFAESLNIKPVVEIIKQ